MRTRCSPAWVWPSSRFTFYSFFGSVEAPSVQTGLRRTSLFRRGPVPGMSIQDTTHADPIIGRLREQISDTDRAIVDLVNKRLQLVERICRRKDALGLPLLDERGREA